MQPTSSDVHVDAVLSAISVAYIQKQTDFIASQVFPVIPVDKQSDKYFTYTKADWFRDEAKLRGDTAESAGSGFNVSTTSYSCDVWALHKDVGRQARQNSDRPLDPEGDAAKFVTQRLLLRQEIQWVTDYFATSIWGTDKTGGTDFTRWSDFAGSDPMEDIELGKETILQNTGFLPNTLVLGYQVFRKLKNHPDFVDRLKYTTNQTITAEIMARLLDVDRVLVAKAIKNTAVEGATATYAFTHGKNALLAHVAPEPGIMVPSAGYIFSWSGISDGLGLSVGTSRIEMPLKKAVRVEGEIAFDDMIIASDLGYFLSGAVL